MTVIWPQPQGESPEGTFEDLSPKDTAGAADHTSQAGFSLQLTDGAHIRYRVSHDPQPLGTKDFPVIAQTLLTIQPPDAPLQGLILGRTGDVPGDLAFTAKGGSISQVNPVTAIQGFARESTPTGKDWPSAGSKHCVAVRLRNCEGASAIAESPEMAKCWNGSEKRSNASGTSGWIEEVGTGAECLGNDSLI